jgi:hypothetical protein
MAGTVHMPPGSVVYRESRHTDGITYELRVYAVDGGLYGTFWCPRCDRAEVNQVLNGTQAEAVASTRKGMDSHHSKAHRPAAMT